MYYISIPDAVRIQQYIKPTKSDEHNVKALQYMKRKSIVVIKSINTF